VRGRTTSATIPIVHTTAILARKPMSNRMIPRMRTPGQQWRKRPRRLLPEGATPTQCRGDARTNVDVTDNRESLGGVVTTISVCRKSGQDATPQTPHDARGRPRLRSWWQPGNLHRPDRHDLDVWHVKAITLLRCAPLSGTAGGGGSAPGAGPDRRYGNRARVFSPEGLGAAGART
jgi:hypothetical protein